MEWILLFLLCLSGWRFSACRLRQYYFVPYNKTWTEAQKHCRQTYTDLATIENSEELMVFMKTSKVQLSEVWIGLYSKVDWRWSDGFNGSGAEFRAWQTSDSEPDFYTDQFCVNARGQQGWWDDRCAIEYTFVCDRGTRLDPDFVYVNQSRNWSSAQIYCRENFRDLATVRNVTEKQRVQNLVPSGEWAWIGLFRDPNFFWSDGSSFFFSHWDSLENLIGSMEVICGAASMDRTGRWRFLSCERTLPFICYSEPVKKHVVKTTMKIGLPSVDMNNTTVGAELLKKLQDTLKGVTGVTLKWREQPDGKVFHKERQRQKKEL
ncbi:C-type mannose receptor 2-like isoform X1 [Parambassis ranga]|uniref:C-type mannose receptor 2-like isoform X1 n=1 Tax=Parambassis ranga TaxID=210632 RepID=A0A6P7K7D7_9TELE|nr:C-type mannose receptor 2-like isoform X1 [Parambassis ranga]